MVVVYDAHARALTVVTAAPAQFAYAARAFHDVSGFWIPGQIVDKVLAFLRSQKLVGQADIRGQFDKAVHDFAWILS
ncbi:hypothetical protein BIZ92_28765 [Achromobacter xylosoxidans]|uniref:Uncharacterized protein n=1 Tax=Alcaligenes xylosoxydans xylosoxydans TaxID=85698 RepID=A0A1R1JRH4_ALCXX|nr:hypothetical protein BIZ92_28765 [Achromobacter xylosoxidans]